MTYAETVPCGCCRAAEAVCSDGEGFPLCAPCAVGETAAQREEGFLRPDQTISGIPGL